MSDCIFCRIVAGEIPSRQVYTDDAAVAILDLAPFKRGHTLVIPRQHVVDALADAEQSAKLAADQTHRFFQAGRECQPHAATRPVRQIGRAHV